MLSYLQLCMASSASMIPSLDLLNYPELISSSSRTYLIKLVAENGPISNYLDFALQLVAANASKVPLESILQVVAAVPELSSILLKKIDVFKSLLNNSKEDVRELSAQILSIIVCHTFDQIQLETFINEMSRNTKDRALEQQHGSILALGYTFGRIVRNHLSSPPSGKENHNRTIKLEASYFVRLQSQC